MAETIADFSNYSLTDLKSDERGVFGLADELLPQMAHMFDYDLESSDDKVDAIQGLIGAIAPEKELQKNIEFMRTKLGPSALAIAIEWVESSGVMKPLDRAFRDNTSLTEDGVDTVLWSGGVANWMLRRRNLTETLDPSKVGRVVLPLGQRAMGDHEHQLVETLRNRNAFSGVVTEYDFGDKYIKDTLVSAGFNIRTIPVESTSGTEIIEKAFDTERGLTDDTILVVGNAPNVIQAAGTVRQVGREFKRSFDSGSDPQLYMYGDSIQLARHGEGTKFHQNPVSALGQILRNSVRLQQELAA